MNNNNKMTSSSNNNNKSVRMLTMKFKVPQNIDASYATMYDEDEEEDAHYEDEIKYDDEENHNDEEEDDEEDISGENDEADITIEEASPPPPTLIEEGETAAEEIIIDEEVEGGNELDTSSSSLSNNNNDADTEFKYVQGMPSSSESWPERVNNFNNGPRDNTKTATTSSVLPPSVLPQQQQILNQKQYAMAQFDQNENELEVIDTLIAQEQEDDIEEEEEEETVLVEGERQDGEEDEREDDEEVEVEDDGDEEEIEKEGGDDEEEEGDDEEMVEEMVEEEGDEEEEMAEEEEEEGDEEEQQQEQEEAPEGEEGENQQQQQDIEEVEAAKSNAHADILPSALDSWCKIIRWHPNEEFTHCSNSMDIPQAAVEDETFRKMYFFQTLVECCQKFFHADECENEDVCPNLAVEEVGEIAFERQADGELEDEVPDDEGQSGDGTDESDDDEDVAEEEEEEANEEEEEAANEEEEGEDASDESNNKSSSTEGQGVQIDEANEKTNWEGFDEDMSHQNVKHEPEQPSSSSIEAHDLSEAQGKDDYEGDGFGVMKYKLLRGKGEGGKSSANPFTTIGSGALVAAFLLILSCCLCCLRYRRRRYAQSKRPSRGNYAALGRHDFFNGTFSDDVSYGKDSDDDISIESYGSDDGGHQTNLEMGGFHEFDANGGLTLEEING